MLANDNKTPLILLQLSARRQSPRSNLRERPNPRSARTRSGKKQEGQLQSVNQPVVPDLPCSAAWRFKRKLTLKILENEHSAFSSLSFPALQNILAVRASSKPSRRMHVALVDDGGQISEVMMLSAYTKIYLFIAHLSKLVLYLIVKIECVVVTWVLSSVVEQSIAV